MEEEFKSVKVSILGLKEQVSMNDIECDLMLYSDCGVKFVEEYARTFMTDGVVKRSPLARNMKKAIKIYQQTAPMVDITFKGGVVYCLGKASFDNVGLQDYLPIGYRITVPKEMICAPGLYDGWDGKIKAGLFRKKLDRFLYNYTVYGPECPKHLRKESKWQGTVGDKISLEVRLDKMYSFTGMYGPSTVYEFSDTDGNKYSWTTSSKEIERYDGYKKISATIKSHDSYKNIETTALKFVKLVP